MFQHHDIYLNTASNAICLAIGLSFVVRFIGYKHEWKRFKKVPFKNDVCFNVENRAIWLRTVTRKIILSKMKVEVRVFVEKISIN